jgi:alkylation response protein AidB-like acyl-CoA dehydrogenase
MAEKDGDAWRVNGQKVWTTLAHRARWALLLARTDPTVRKHKGLTFFVVDMKAPGVEVRPLYELTGEAEFNEVFLDNVRIPDSQRVGTVGGGWQVALTTLMSERIAASRRVAARGSGPISQVLETWASCPDRSPARRDLVCRLWIEAEVLRLTSLRASQAGQLGIFGPEGSTSKLHWAELNKKLTALTVDLAGPAGMLNPTGYPFVRPSQSSIDDSDRTKAFLRARANSIEGGTSEIQRNILGERILGLPGEPRTDAAIPWRDVPRN